METENDNTPKRPRVFISYSWSPDGNAEFVLEQARTLQIEYGIDVIIDQWSLEEGELLDAFMERMVIDKSIDKVLLFCNEEYVRKADSRKGGVGVEGAIISSKLYLDLGSSRFIPVYCERDSEGKFFSPTFIGLRKGINLCDDYEEGLERLARSLWGKPEVKKPDSYGIPSFLKGSDEYQEDLRKYYLKAKVAAKKSSSQFIPLVEVFIQKIADQIESKLVDDFDRLTGPKAKEVADNINIFMQASGKYREDIIDLLISHLNETENFSQETFFIVNEALINSLISKLDFPSNLYNPHVFALIEEVFIFSVSILLKYRYYQSLEEVLGKPFWIENGPNGSDYYYYFELLRNQNNYSRATRLLRQIENNESLSFVSKMIHEDHIRSKFTKPLEIYEADCFIHYVTHIRHKDSWLPFYFYILNEVKELSFIKKMKSVNFFDAIIPVYGVETASQFIDLVLSASVNSAHDYRNYRGLRRPSSAFNIEDLRTVP